MGYIVSWASGVTDRTTGRDKEQSPWQDLSWVNVRDIDDSKDITSQPPPGGTWTGYFLSSRLCLHTFNFNLYGTNVITNIRVTLNKKANLIVDSPDYSHMKDFEIYLTKDSGVTVDGNNLADIDSVWPTGGVFESFDYEDSDPRWGTGFIQDEIAQTGFGVVIAVSGAVDQFGHSGKPADIDYVEMTIFGFGDAFEEPPGVSGEIPLFIEGYLPSSSSISLFTDGDVHNSIDFYTSGPKPANSNISLYTYGDVHNNFDLYIDGYGVGTNNVTLYTYGITSHNDSVLLYTQGSLYPNEVAYRSLYMAGPLPAVSSLSLYTYGIGKDETMSLYELGHDNANLSSTLYIYGIGKDETMTLYTYGHDTSLGHMNLYLKTQDVSYASGDLDLFMWATQAGVDGMYNFMPLYLYTKVGPYDQMNLFLKTGDLGTIDDDMNLYIGGHYASKSSWTTLYLCNTGIDSGVPLYVRGSGITDGALPFNKYMPLFIGKQGTYERLWLYTTGPWNSASGYASLFVEGVLPYVSSLPLVLPNTIDNKTNTLELYSHGI